MGVQCSNDFAQEERDDPWNDPFLYLQAMISKKCSIQYGSKSSSRPNLLPVFFEIVLARVFALSISYDSRAVFLLKSIQLPNCEIESARSLGFERS